MLATDPDCRPRPNHAPIDFHLADANIARRPPEQRGLARDQVRMLVTMPDHERPRHEKLCDLVDLLRPGDLVVVNDSQTLPAADSPRNSSAGSPAATYDCPR